MTIEETLTQRATQGLLDHLNAAFDARPGISPLEVSLAMINLACDTKAPSDFRGIAILALRAIMHVSLKNADRELFMRKMAESIPAVIAERAGAVLSKLGVP